MNKNCILLLFFALTTNWAIASSISWNTADIWTMGNDGYYVSLVGDEVGEQAYVWFTISPWGWPNYDLFELNSVDLSDTLGCMVGNWLSAEPGDVVDASTTRNQLYYFNHCEIDDETVVIRPVRGSQNSTIYLMFVVEDINDYNYKVENPAYYYGWVALNVDGDCNVTVGSSAIAPEGELLIVGVTPEPTSGLLMLLGMAGLALKRKRA